MKAFISYSHKDKEVLDRLHVHLATLQREGSLTTWYDREILAGSELDSEIGREMESANLFLLLVSPDFLASDYCIETEMVRALERHDAGDARVVPIIIEPCDWAATSSLRKLKAVPRDGKPISEWTNANSAYLDIVQELRKVETASASPSPPRNNQLDRFSDKGMSTAPTYRVQKTFDEIDKQVFREASFEALQAYFEAATLEVDQVEGLKARFKRSSETSFTCTLVNREKVNSVAHITIRLEGGSMSMGDLVYSFDQDPISRSANGWFQVDHDEYEQFLRASTGFHSQANEKLSASEAAKVIWVEFIAQAGVTHA